MKKVLMNTKVCELYVGEDAYKYVNNLYYGWGPELDQREIGELIKEVWPNNDIVAGLNELNELNESGAATLINFSSNPDINFIAIRHKEKAKCALVYAGGGYSCVCNATEALPVAMALYHKGFNVFMGTYGILDRATNGTPVKDIIEGISYLEKHQDELNIDMSDYMIGGFSAGGHAVAELLTDNVGLATTDVIKPKLVFLGYPVITLTSLTHGGSRGYLLGNHITEEGINKYSVEKHLINIGTKMYFWQCSRDNTVPIENTQLLEKACKTQKIDYIYNTYDSDAHGWGIATGKLAEGWIDEMVAFYNK